MMVHQPLKNNTIHYMKRGFSIIEMLIVFAIMALFFAVAGPRFLGYLESGRVRTTQATLRQIKSDIFRYYTDTNQYPETLEDLIREPGDEGARKNWMGPYLSTKSVPKDPWGSELVYQVTPDTTNPYELYSRGPKKKSATQKDWISAWDDK